MENVQNDTIEKKLLHSTLWLNTEAVGLGIGLVCGLIVFVATNWLVIKGGPTVGPHLQLLSQFFIGYSVTFLGSLIGFMYGFALGAMTGGLIAWIYNKIAALRE